MSNLFEPNATVMYGSHGACTVVEIAEKEFAGEKKDYYVLRPLRSGTSLYYVPLDSEVLTARMHTPPDTDTFCRAVAETEAAEWIFEDRSRQNWLKQVVEAGGTVQMLRAHRMLVAKRTELSELGKKLRAADDRFLRDIEELLLEEISLVFPAEKEKLTAFLHGACDLADV